jgi:hypothetical protein
MERTAQTAKGEVAVARAKRRARAETAAASPVQIAPANRNGRETIMEDGLLDLLASGGGAAVGGLAVSVLHKKFDVDREIIGIGAAAIGMFGASQTTGLVRHAALGLAASGIATTIVELIHQWDPEWLRNPDAKNPPTRQAETGDFISREDLQAAIAKMAEMQKVSEAQMAALKEQMRAVVAEAVASASSDALSAEELAHLQTIADQLTEPERAEFVHIETRGDPDIVRRMRRTLLQMPIDEAVAYLRAKVLSRRPRPRNGA